MNFTVSRKKQQLDRIFELSRDLPQEEEMLAHWARYLCVLTCGFFESSIRQLIASYVNTTANKRTANYVKHHTRRLTNLNDDKLKQLLGAFSEEWRIGYESRLSSDQKDAIDSIFANRNRIAHHEFNKEVQHMVIR